MCLLGWGGEGGYLDNQPCPSIKTAGWVEEGLAWEFKTFEWTHKL